MASYRTVFQGKDNEKNSGTDENGKKKEKFVKLSIVDKAIILTTSKNLNQRDALLVTYEMLCEIGKFYKCFNKDGKEVIKLMVKKLYEEDFKFFHIENMEDYEDDDGNGKRPN